MGCRMHLTLARPRRGIFLRKTEHWRRTGRLGWNWSCLDLVSLTKDFSWGGKNDFAFLTAREPPTPPPTAAATTMKSNIALNQKVERRRPRMPLSFVDLFGERGGAAGLMY
jgi:hypothetical protein